MGSENTTIQTHPSGEIETGGNLPQGATTSLDTFAGKVHTKWMPGAAVSSLGQMPFFIEFLKASGLFDQWVEDCPLSYTSNNAPLKRDVLGTLVLSVLSGHWRYAHISAIRGDGINPELLGMTRVASEDSVRGAYLSSYRIRSNTQGFRQLGRGSGYPGILSKWHIPINRAWLRTERD